MAKDEMNDMFFRIVSKILQLVSTKHIREISFSGNACEGGQVMESVFRAFS